MSLLISDNPHQSLLEQRLPAWARHAQPEHWQSLIHTQQPAQGVPAAEADWFANAAPDLREAVLASQVRLQRSQQVLARSLKGLKQISEFAEPLLAQQLATEYQLSVPLNSSELIHIHHLFTWQTYVSHHERRSLLEAALHNFEDDVGFSRESALVLAGDAQVSTSIVIGKTTLGDSETLVDVELESETYTIKPLSLSPADFARTCRALDLGQQYQAHLSAMLSPQQVSTLAIRVQQDRLRLAAHLGFLRRHINGDALDKVLALLDAGPALACSQLQLFGIDLHEALILDLQGAGLLLHLPGHATSLRQFSDLSALHQQLRDDLLQGNFRQQFLAYIPRDQQAVFLDRLHQNLDAGGASRNDQDWPLRDGADLHLVQVAIEDELFKFLHQDHITRLKTEARALAVPTADADEQARKRRLAQWQSLGLNTLMLAGMFVPGVGTLMTAVVVYQLLDEVYEGYQAWSVGDRQLALRHLAAVGLNLALIGGLHVAGKVVPKLFNSPLMEGLDEVRLDDNSHRLWQPDLTPYRSPAVIPDGLSANPLGQYLHQDSYFIRIDGQLYEQRFDSERQQWRIVHPDTPKTWQPPLEHNGEGAWRGVHEQPQLWDLPTLVRRLDPSFSDFSNEDLRLATQISAVSETRLRQVHLGGQATPPQLRDTLERLAAVRKSPSGVEEVVQDAHSLQLTETYPHLDAPLARTLLKRLQADELRAWQSGKPLPTWFQHTAQQVNDGLPMARALEGLHVPGLNSAHSDHLLFACLDRLPGWSPKVRLELRGGNPQGPLLASAGAEAATQRCLVIKSSQGYEAYLGERPAAPRCDHDLSRAVLDALPAERRQALVADTGTIGLRQQVQALADHSRTDLARRLWGYKAPTWGPAGRLRGGTDQPFEFPAISPLRTSLTARYRRLFPAASDEEIESTLSRWRRNLQMPEIELRTLEARLQDLRRDLATWAQGSTARQRATQPIINAWRRNAPYTLTNGETIQRLDLAYLGLEDQDLASLTLPDDFQHVFDLNLSGNRQLSQVPFNLISRFTGLQRLQLGNCRFDHIPHLINAPALAWLDLQYNRLTWDAWAQVALERMPNLSVLDLSDNPLLQAPDLSRLHNLRSVFISNASLTQLPAGLAGMNNPLAIDLSNNQFITLPNNFTVPTRVGEVMSLESEWLSPQIRLQIAAYYDTHGIDLLVDDSDYEALLQNTDNHQQQIWNRLPLHYRHGLREIPELEIYLDYPQQTRAELWRRLALMDTDNTFRQRALARPASELLELTL
ncbi:dermonecrotic toxin domain-containing protein [Pseudomonas sp. UM16]|uniref:dermonecrotic toxin domain-containing protein n=1 Tax=Pseudomonas sp. UM16 TaxID=3158962 RepID=UPI00398F9C0A